ncbi:hypothetical protein LP419_36070 [Massilia sp. H-1]|nr:hypothetical protein LP419_36070 [Massilia sp. H-1]
MAGGRGVLERLSAEHHLACDHGRAFLRRIQASSGRARISDRIGKSSRRRWFDRRLDTATTTAAARGQQDGGANGAEGSLETLQIYLHVHTWSPGFTTLLLVCGDYAPARLKTDRFVANLLRINEEGGRHAYIRPHAMLVPP